jgi:alpha-beta hydrolase superfamily lysophospholipase
VAIQLIAAGCAPLYQPRLALKGEPVLNADHLRARDGYVLPLRFWPVDGQEKAVAIALHGFNDYSNAFAGPAAFWASQGVTVYAFDQRGFGATAFRGLWPGTDVLARDLKDVVTAVRRQHPGRPLYLVGESMGAAVTLVAMTDKTKPNVDGVVLAAPAVWGTHLKPFARSMAWLMAHFASGYRMSGSALDIRASDDIEMLKTLGRDPLVIKETRADTIWGLVRLMEEAEAAAPKVRTKILLLLGERDEVIPKEQFAELARALHEPRVIRYENGWHLLFRDLGKDKVWRDTLEWMLDQAVLRPKRD